MNRHEVDQVALELVQAAEHDRAAGDQAAADAIIERVAGRLEAHGVDLNDARQRELALRIITAVDSVASRVDLDKLALIGLAQEVSLQLFTAFRWSAIAVARAHVGEAFHDLQPSDVTEGQAGG